MTESGGESAKLQKSFPYEDIVNLPHHRSETHPHMSMEERAAQFSSFAAIPDIRRQCRRRHAVPAAGWSWMRIRRHGWTKSCRNFAEGKKDERQNLRFLSR